MAREIDLRDRALLGHRPERTVSEDETARLLVDDRAAQRNLGPHPPDVGIRDHERTGLHAQGRGFVPSPARGEHGGRSHDGGGDHCRDDDRHTTGARQSASNSCDRVLVHLLRDDGPVRLA